MSFIINPYSFGGGGPPPGGFPDVTAVRSSPFGSSATSHAADNPASIPAGSLIVWLFSAESPSPVTTPSGYTYLTSYYDMFGSDMEGWIYTKIADGSEAGGTTDFVTSAARRGAATCVVISGADGAAEFSVMRLTGTSSTPTSPTASWGALDNLFLHIAFGYNSLTATGYPLPDDNASYPQTAIGSHYVSSKQEAAASVTPGNLTFGSAQYIVNFILAVKPV